MSASGCYCAREEGGEGRLFEGGVKGMSVHVSFQYLPYELIKGKTSHSSSKQCEEDDEGVK